MLMQQLRVKLVNLFGDLYEKLKIQDIFEPTIGNESQLENNIINDVKVLNFVTSKNAIAKYTAFEHRNVT
jgi:hypothetical protein